MSAKYDYSWPKDATCHNCGEKGHIKPNFPQINTGVTNNNNGSKSKMNKPAKIIPTIIMEQLPMQTHQILNLIKRKELIV